MLINKMAWYCVVLWTQLKSWMSSRRFVWVVCPSKRPAETCGLKVQWLSRSESASNSAGHANVNKWWLSGLLHYGFCIIWLWLLWRVQWATQFLYQALVLFFCCCPSLTRLQWDVSLNILMKYRLYCIVNTLIQQKLNNVQACKVAYVC